MITKQKSQGIDYAEHMRYILGNLRTEKHLKLVGKYSTNVREG